MAVTIDNQQIISAVIGIQGPTADVTPELLAARDIAVAAATSTELLAAAALTGSPKETYTYLSELQAAYPTGNTGVYLVLGNVAEVDTLAVTGAPTASGNLMVTLDGTAKTVAVTTGTAEVASLTITAIPTADGNLTVILNGVATTVAVTTTAQTTTDLVATAIRGTTFTGWTTGGTGSVITFTATAVGVKTNAVYSAGTTGSTGTMSTTTQGVDADTNTTVATKIRATAFTGWTISGSGTSVIYTSTTTGSRTTPVFAAGTTGVAAAFTVTELGADNDGYVYSWSGSAWVPRVIYQATGTADESIQYLKLDAVLKGDKFTQFAFGTNPAYNSTAPESELNATYGTSTLEWLANDGSFKEGSHYLKATRGDTALDGKNFYFELPKQYKGLITATARITINYSCNCSWSLWAYQRKSDRATVCVPNTGVKTSLTTTADIEKQMQILVPILWDGAYINLRLWDIPSGGIVRIGSIKCSIIGNLVGQNDAEKALNTQYNFGDNPSYKSTNPWTLTTVSGTSTLEWITNDGSFKEGSYYLKATRGDANITAGCRITQKKYR